MKTDTGSPPPTAGKASSNLVFDLRSVVERLDLIELFTIPQPLEVELGCGDATFIAQYATLHPERNFLGVERLLGRISKLDRKGRRASLTNLRGIRIESAYLLEWLLPPQCATALHIYFPDPWPKQKHRRHRLINERFPSLAQRILVPEGVVYLRTDDADYFQQMNEVFANDKSFRPVDTPPELITLITDFEKDFNAQSIPTLRAAYRLIHAA